MKVCTSLSALMILVLATGCSSSGGVGGSSIINPPPVSAQAGYSNASINGTYSIYLIRDSAENVIGSFKADGNGNITSGTFFDNVGAGAPVCQFSVTGTYSLQSNASGTAKIIPIIPSSGACGGVATTNTVSFTIEAAQQGDSILIAASDNNMFTGSAASVENLRDELLKEERLLQRGETLVLPK